jgi:hypothetical protein
MIGVAEFSRFTYARVCPAFFLLVLGYLARAFAFFQDSLI